MDHISHKSMIFQLQFNSTKQLALVDSGANPNTMSPATATAVGADVVDLEEAIQIEYADKRIEWITQIAWVTVSHKSYREDIPFIIANIGNTPILGLPFWEDGVFKVNWR